MVLPWGVVWDGVPPALFRRAVRGGVRQRAYHSPRELQIVAGRWFTDSVPPWRRAFRRRSCTIPCSLQGRGGGSGGDAAGGWQRPTRAREIAGDAARGAGAPLPGPPPQTAWGRENSTAPGTMPREEWAPPPARILATSPKKPWGRLLALVRRRVGRGDGDSRQARSGRAGSSAPGWPRTTHRGVGSRHPSPAQFAGEGPGVRGSARSATPLPFSVPDDDPSFLCRRSVLAFLATSRPPSLTLLLLERASEPPPLDIVPPARRLPPRISHHAMNLPHPYRRPPVG